MSHDELGPQLAERFRYVLVDEYQDLNSLQVEIVRLLAPEGKGLTVVGDEAQAIYGFRGSDPRRLRQVVSCYPDAVTMRLERNFRSRQSVLDVANEIRPRSEGEPSIPPPQRPRCRIETEPQPLLRRLFGSSGHRRANS